MSEPVIVTVAVDAAPFEAALAELVQLLPTLRSRCPEVGDALCDAARRITDGLPGAFGLENAPAADAGEAARALVVVQLSQAFRVLVAAVRAAHDEAVASDRVAEIRHDGSPSVVRTPMVNESPSAGEAGGGSAPLAGRRS